MTAGREMRPAVIVEWPVTVESPATVERGGDQEVDCVDGLLASFTFTSDDEPPRV